MWRPGGSDARRCLELDGLGHDRQRGASFVFPLVHKEVKAIAPPPSPVPLLLVHMVRVLVMVACLGTLVFVETPRTSRHRTSSNRSLVRAFFSSALSPEQVTEMTRQIAVAAKKPLSASQVSMLAARARNVLTTGDCPVYKLFLRRTLGVIRETLVEGGMPEERFVAVVRKVGLERVAHGVVVSCEEAPALGWLGRRR